MILSIPPCACRRSSLSKVRASPAGTARGSGGAPPASACQGGAPGSEVVFVWLCALGRADLELSQDQLLQLGTLTGLEGSCVDASVHIHDLLRPAVDSIH